jgi:hypothetical protein
MHVHPAHALVSRPVSPLARAQRRTKAVAGRNARLLFLTFIGFAVVVTLACLALWFAAHPTM